MVGSSLMLHYQRLHPRRRRLLCKPEPLQDSQEAYRLHLGGNLSLTPWRSCTVSIQKLLVCQIMEYVPCQSSAIVAHPNLQPLSDFYPRQARSLTKVAKAQAAVKSKTTGQAVGEIPRIDELTAFYTNNCPTGETTIMHGDYKMDNVVFHKTKPEVIGYVYVTAGGMALMKICSLLDWELSTLGHPFADLGNLLMPFFWAKAEEKSDLAYVSSTDSKSSSSDNTRYSGFSQEQLDSLPSQEELLRYYCEKRGRQYPLPRWTACQSFSFFRVSHSELYH